MFGCCCANKKALKNKELKNGEQKNGETKAATGETLDNNNSSKSPQKNTSATDATVAAVIVSPKSPLSNSSRSEITNGKSSGSEEGNNNLGGLIMSDGLVGESCSHIAKHINSINYSNYFYEKNFSFRLTC